MAITRLNNNSITSITALPNAISTGISMADQWRLTANKDCTSRSGQDIDANLERVDEPSFSGIGTGMTESSGIFTFPNTGIYYVTANGRFSNAQTDYCAVMINTTQNNSSYQRASENYTMLSGNSAFNSMQSSLVIDVTDTSNVKVKFTVRSYVESGSVKLNGDTDENETYFTFIRLGDT